jgi:folate-dependent phosphoribosylglycinamide formyltransferase PurN
VKGLERAEAAGIPAFVVSRKRIRDPAQFSDAITEVLDRFRPDLVTMAGFLSLWRIPPHYEGRVLNIHPALIPLFCGKGFYGMRVHDAVVASGVKFSGCTVHFADNVYDHGPIVIQRVVPVRFEDTPEDVQKRVFAEECEAYPDAIRLFAEGRLTIVENRVRIE